MKRRIIESGGIRIVVIESDALVITDAQSALDLLVTAQYEDECSRIAIPKEAIIEDFFKLSTGIAGEVLQKVSNYRKRLAIIGDFTSYSSKPLHDFIYECNNGNCVSFVKTEQEAIAWLAR